MLQMYDVMCETKKYTWEVLQWLTLRRIQSYSMQVKRFLFELSKQIRKRINLDANGVLEKLRILDPSYALNEEQSPITVGDIAANFPNLVTAPDLNYLDEVWREF